MTDLEAAVDAVLAAWDAEYDPEKQDLSEGLWAAIAAMRRARSEESEP
jgi:hypothetical protein